MKGKPIKNIGILLIIMNICIACNTSIPDNGDKTPDNMNEEKIQNAETEEFIVTQKIYDQTFSEIYIFLEKIQKIIDEIDFINWKLHLTDEYIAKFSDPQYLKALSEKPQLKDQNIVLNSLYDFFINVFIPSRNNSNLVRIEFVNKQRVKTITIIKNTPYILYLLEKDKNNEWKIGIW